MMRLRNAYKKFSRALREKDFGFVDSPLGQLALAMLDDGNAVLVVFREAEEAEDARESARKARRRAPRTQYHGKWI